jgi:hypothetical protein
MDCIIGNYRAYAGFLVGLFSADSMARIALGFPDGRGALRGETHRTRGWRKTLLGGFRQGDASPTKSFKPVFKKGFVRFLGGTSGFLVAFHRATRVPGYLGYSQGERAGSSEAEVGFGPMEERFVPIKGGQN